VEQKTDQRMSVGNGLQFTQLGLGLEEKLKPTSVAQVHFQASQRSRAHSEEFW
jgi:hypothetical protein